MIYCSLFWRKKHLTYIFTFTFYKNWTLSLYFHFYFLQELKPKKRKNDQCVWFHLFCQNWILDLYLTFTFYTNTKQIEKGTVWFYLFCQTRDKRRVLYSGAIVQGGFHRNTCKWHVIENKKTVLIWAVHTEVFWLIKHYRQHWQQLFQGHPPKNISFNKKNCHIILRTIKHYEWDENICLIWIMWDVWLK